jgi:hypothetical protein
MAQNTPNRKGRRDMASAPRIPELTDTEAERELAQEYEYTADGQRIAYRLPGGTPVLVAPLGMEYGRWLFSPSSGDSCRLRRGEREHERRQAA